VSADWWVVAHRPGCEGDCSCPSDDRDLNITYNLTPMLREAGLFPNAHRDLWHAPCAEVAGVADAALRRLESDPARFRELNPPNGWGSYEGAVDWVRRLRDLCQSWSHIPGARLEGSL
jgi:hypothetical protein